MQPLMFGREVERLPRATGLWRYVTILAALCGTPTSVRAGADDDFRSYARRHLEGPAVEFSYWQRKPPVADTGKFPAQPNVRPADRAAAARLRAGEFAPNSRFQPRRIGVPPPWDVNPERNNTWDLHRHSLQWLEPLVRLWAVEGDRACGALVWKVIDDWERHNGREPGRSEFAWDDHATANRLRMLVWVWEIYRRQPEFEPRAAVRLLEMIRRHAVWIDRLDVYSKRPNQSMEMNDALLTVAVVIPEFEDASSWHRLASRRTEKYFRQTFSKAGFHLEQSPDYFWFAAARIANLRRFLEANQQPEIEGLDALLRRAAVAMAWLIQPDGRPARLGDTEDRQTPPFPEYVREWWPRDPPALSESSFPNPRGDRSAFIHDFESGYAIFSGDRADRAARAPDSYAVFRSRAFEHRHFQHDVLTFIYYGLGRTWIVDPGMYNYIETDPMRRYVRSSAAHNLVLADDRPHTLGKIKLIDAGRTRTDDFIIVEHDFGAAEHTREFRFEPDYALTIRDDVRADDGRTHSFAQVFHVAAGLRVDIRNDREAELIAPDGARCRIEQRGAVGRWSIVTGRRGARPQGWYSPNFNQIEPIPALYFSVPAASRAAQFDTRLTLLRAGQTAR